jgi:putrescine---pyruvate transaminase
MILDFKGLIPGPQTQLKPIDLSQSWNFGFIKDSGLVIDPLMHHACYTLGYSRQGFIDSVMERMKSVKPETTEVSTIIDSIPKVNHVSYQLAEKLYELSGGYRSFFALSGSDANEGAIKLASAYHSAKGNRQKKNVVSLMPSYHGSTLLTSSLGFENVMPDPFYTMDRYHGVIRVERDFAKDSVDWSTVSCIMVETCQYSNHLTPFTNDFWKKLNDIRLEHDVLIVIDDIFMGGGKTGQFIGWKHLPIEPDIFTMGKAITAGYFPLSATLYNDNISNVLGKEFGWNHGYTYSFTIPGICSALEYLKILEEDELLSKHDVLVEKATNVFLESEFSIVGRFGLYFMISFKNIEFLFFIPLTASDEYFAVLKDNLEQMKILINNKLGYSVVVGGMQ